MKQIYTYEKCQEISKQYKNKKDFYTNEKSAYYAIITHKWYELLSHFEKIGSKYKRCVYIYKFSENIVYIGLTFNLKKRDKDHRRKGSVYKYGFENNVQIPEPIQLTDYIDFSMASQIECELIEEYKKNGFHIINKMKGGGLGGMVRTVNISKEKCLEKAKLCKNITEFKQKYYSLYTFSCQNGFENEIREILYFDKKRKVCVFDVDGNFIEVIDSLKECEKKYQVKSLSETCKIKGYQKNFKFVYYDDWCNMDKPIKIETRLEYKKKSILKTITKRNARYKIYGNPQTNKKRSVKQRIKISKPIVMLTLNMEVVDVLCGVSFAYEKYNLPKNFLKSVYDIMNNKDKSCYGFKWFYLKDYNEYYGTNLVVNEILVQK
jgi:predicted GIY-YIG superfamily endonuclease